jgi:carbon monoxide dehydrogenase subunit G
MGLSLLLRCILAPGVAGMVLVGPHASAQERPSEVMSEVSREGEHFVVSASAEVAVPRAIAWAVLTDYERYPEFVPEIDAVRVLSRNGNGMVLQQKGRMSFMFFSHPVDVTLAVVETPRQQVVSRSLAGNLRDFSGRYALAETAGGVRLSYSARFVPEFELPPLLGSVIVRSVLERNLAALLHEMRRRQAQVRSDPAH